MIESLITTTEITSPDFWSSPTPIILNPGVSVAEISQLTDFVKKETHLQNHLLFSSSGTSGNRKWIALSKSALEWSARQVIQTINLNSSDICGLALPTFHVGGFGLAARAYFSGASFGEYSEKWNAQSFTHWIADQKITVTSLVPTQISDLVAANLSSPSALRIAIIGGGKIDPQIKSQALQLGWPVRESYGMTEASSQVATENNDGELILLDGWQARLTDITGIANTLQLKSPGLLTGYVTRDHSGKFTFQDPKSDGWLTTTDRVELTGRKLTFLGRTDRRIKILGELVDLDALEQKLSQLISHPFILKSLDDPRLGKKLQLLVENAPRTLIEAHLKTYNQSAPGFERITDFQITKKLPRSPLGKILPL